MTSLPNQVNNWKKHCYLLQLVGSACFLECLFIFGLLAFCLFCYRYSSWPSCFCLAQLGEISSLFVLYDSVACNFQTLVQSAVCCSLLFHKKKYCFVAFYFWKDLDGHFAHDSVSLLFLCSHCSWVFSSTHSIVIMEGFWTIFFSCSNYMKFH